MTIDDKKLRDYLLGRAAEDDDEAISLSIVSGDDLAERLERAENDLVEDHLDGLLSGPEDELFRKNFLASPQRRELIREISLLRAGVRQAGSADTSAAVKRTSRHERRGLFFMFSRPVIAFGSLLLMLFAGSLIWYVFVRDARTPLEAEYAAINRRELGDPAKTAGFSVINLVSANMRDAASTAAHPAAGLTQSVVFRLALPVSEAEGAEIEASIERSGKRAFTVGGRVFRNQFGSELRFIAPKSVLPPGAYQIVLRSAGKNDKTTYQLRID